MDIYFNQGYVLISCGREGCDQSFAVSESFYEETSRTKETWHCPRGHKRVWANESTEEKLAAAEARNRHLDDQLRAATEEVEATKHALLKDRHRFANGVCPCCNRSFVNVARHMRSQHPDYDLTHVEGVARPEYTCSCGYVAKSYRGLRTHQGHARGWHPDSWYKPDTPAWKAHRTVVGG